MPRALGIAAQGNLQIAGRIASDAERLGYATAWTNDTSSGDGIATAAAMLRATNQIRVGIGALACDRWSAPQIAYRLETARVPLQRLVVVLGAGRSAAPVRAVENTAAQLRILMGSALRIGVAALGPAMCRLGGRIGDLVLLNWSTPVRIEWSRARIHQGAAVKGKAGEGISVIPEVAAYVRVALGEDAEDLFAREAATYRAIGHYRGHFEAMGQAPGIVAADASQVREALKAYDEVLDETVVRALGPAQAPERLVAVAQAAAPGES